MRVSALGSLLCFAVAVTVVSAAHAQTPAPGRTRYGTWFSGGLGMGSMGCRTCNGRTTGLTGDFAIGGTLGQMFLIGGGITGWTHSANGLTRTVGLADVVMRLYTSEHGNLFFLLGGGAGMVSRAISGTGPSGSEIGAGIYFGMGYDIRMGKKLSLTPYWQIFGSKTENLDVNVGQIGLSITVQ